MSIRSLAREIIRKAQQATGDLSRDTDDGDVSCEADLKKIEELAHQILTAPGVAIIREAEPGGRIHLRIPLNEIPWIDAHIDREGDRLLAPVAIGTAFHHLEAWEITRQKDEDGILVFEPHTEIVIRLHEAHDMVGTMETTVINGRTYALYMQPYSD